MAMIKNYLHIFARNIIKNKLYSSINIIGFALALICWIFLTIWMNYETNLSDSRDEGKKLIRIGRYDREISEIIIREGCTDMNILYPESPAPLKDFLIKNIPDIEYAVRFGYKDVQEIILNGKISKEYRFAFADSTILKIFRFKYIKGNSKTAFAKSNPVIITETTAKRYFSHTNALGKKIYLNDGRSYEVSAVIKDIPEIYNFKFDFLSTSFFNENEESENPWASDKVNTYAFIDKDVSIPRLENEMNNYLSTKKCGLLRIWAMPHISVHENILAYSDRIEDDYIYDIFLIIIFFIILTACINYSNISTAISSKRAVEIGLRKVFGANRIQIIIQFLSEAVIQSSLGAFIAIIASVMILPYINGITGMEMQIEFSNLFLLKFILLAIGTGILAGIYPALIISQLRPANILKGDIRSGLRGEIFRKVIVVFQFSVSITLIISSLIVYEQYDFIDNKKVAYDKEYYLEIELNKDFDLEKLRNDLTQNNQILSVDFDNRIKEHPKQGQITRLIINLGRYDIRETVDYIKEIIESYIAKDEFKYSFINSGFNEIYRINKSKAEILYYLTLVIIIISYIGLYGHSAFMIKQKSGELAIRKVFGANFRDILIFLSSDYLKLVFVSNIIAFFFVVWPLNTWFIRFAFRINISYEAFLYTFLITMFLTLLTVSYHSIIVSLSNPTDKLLRE